MKFFNCKDLQCFGVSNIFPFEEKKIFGKEVFGYKLFSNTGNILKVFIRKPYFTTPGKVGFFLTWITLG